MKVDAIYVVHFGPGDLSADMDLDFATQRDRMMEAWRQVKAATAAAGKWTLAPRGYGFDDADMLIVEMELMLLARAASTIVPEHRASASQAPEPV